MCGILGVVCRPKRLSEGQFSSALESLAHRGPDQSAMTRKTLGGWEVWFGHTRLAILDLSKAGAQPMERTWRGRSLSIIYNGEVYNHLQLRHQLSDFWSFESTSDTETVLAGIGSEGGAFVAQTNGMFAFAFLDEDCGELVLARDRLGQKPLYIYRESGGELIAFASELKAFAALGLSLSIDERALSFYRWLSCIPAHMTAYTECAKFPPATWGTLDLRAAKLGEFDEHLYWDPLSSMRETFEGTYEDALKQFCELFDDAVRARLLSDVPVGVFLSGGIDSSLVVASLAHIGADIKAFTVKPSDAQFDESHHAIETARYLGVESCILELKESDYTEQIQKIAWHYDEPFSGLSQVPTMAIAQKAREYVKVVLTGDGGDESFLGYPWVNYPGYLLSKRTLVAKVPFALKFVTWFLSTSIGERALKEAVEYAGFNTETLDVKLLILQRLFTSSEETLHSHLYDYFHTTSPRELLSSSDQAHLGQESMLAWCQQWYPSYDWESLKRRSIPEQLGARDLISYLRDDILVKVDRATMAYSLEARSPFLDYRVVEFAQSLPLSFKVREGRFKALLRDVLAQRVPGEVYSLPKRGFGIPFPEGLPPAHNQAASWNKYIEARWRETAGV